MILNNKQMLESVTVLSQLEEKGMLGYAIMRNRQKLAAEVMDYSRKRDELLKEHGTDIGNGQYQLEPENAARFFEALRPYSELTVDVPVMQVSQEVFCSGNLTSSQMLALEWMVQE
jgi:hypothetical protein